MIVVCFYGFLSKHFSCSNNGLISIVLAKINHLSISSVFFLSYFESMLELQKFILGLFLKPNIRIFGRR